MRTNRSDEPRTMGLLRWTGVLVLAGMLAGCSAVPRMNLPPALTSVSAGATEAGGGAAITPNTPPTSGAGAGVGSAPSIAPGPAQGPVRPPVPAAPDLSKLQQQIAAYITNQSGTYGVYVIDIASGKATGVNADTVFPTASTFKLPMSMYILNQVDQGKASLDEKLTYTDADYEEGTGTLQGSVSDGDQFTVRQLIQLAIEQSDNIATNMLLDRFGRDNVYAYMKKLGGKVTTFDDPAEGPINGTTPREMATYMRLAYGKNAIGDSKLRQFLLDLLAHTAFDDRTAAGVPSGIKVAHKIGTLPNVVNDVALVYAPKRTFVVAVYSMDVEEDPAADVIASVTRMVYNFEGQLAGK